MRRIHAFECHELPGCPAAWRNAFTDFMSFYAERFDPYKGVVPLLEEALDRSSTARIVDLCSGAGSPLLTLLPRLERHLGRRPEITLTDKYPNQEAFLELERKGLARGVPESVDAARVPTSLVGFRTVFTAFHHLDWPEAQSVLADAVAQHAGIGIFEYTERHLLLWTLPLLLSPALMWLLVPFIRPFRWQRLLWTYVVPVVPLMGVWDGFVSCLRTYTVDELRSMASVHPEFEWRAGQVPSLGLSRVTYLVGWPRS